VTENLDLNRKTGLTSWWICPALCKFIAFELLNATSNIAFASAMQRNSALRAHAAGFRHFQIGSQPPFADDPNTDWAQVDIKALRDHLVDLDNVTTRASIERTVDGIGVTFIVTGDDVVAASIRRMVLTHSPMLQGISDWTVIADETEGGASMLVQVRSDEELNQVLGLGFFGLMTIGAHHQQHHLMIAIG